MANVDGGGEVADDIYGMGLRSVEEDSESIRG